jgi:gliding motility-associated-like protein
LLGTALLAQPVCSITLGPDETICQGETVQLNGPPGFPNYSWSNGANTQDITVGAAGVYTCTASYPTGNLAVNPNFNLGNTGFSSMFNYTLPLTADGNYWIGSNANLFHSQWQGTGTGPFLMVNAGWMHPGWRFWCQTHPVCPGQTYTISFRAMALASQGPPLIAVFVNNQYTGNDFQLGAQGVWQVCTTTWTAPAGVTSADFCVQVSSGHGVGNDIGFDDVSITATISMSDDIEVFVTPLPVFDLGPDQTLCDGQGTVLDATVPGGTYLWQDGSTAPTYAVSSANNYSVTVTANNCSATDDVDVNYNPLPVFNLGPDLVLCDGDVTTLDATTPGATYAWMDGSSGATHGVNAPGIYGVTVTVNGCSAYDEVDVGYNPLPVVDLGPDQQVCAGQAVLLDATVVGATYLWSDGSTGPTLSPTTSGTHSVTVTLNGCSASDAMDLVVTPLPLVDLGPDQVVCPGTAITLDATTPGASYLWSTGAVTASITTSMPGTYSVQVTVNGCSASDAMDLTNHALPVFDIGPDQTICAGTSTSFSATVAGATYAWSTGAGTNSITTGTAGTYWLDVTTNGCTARDSVDLFVTPLPVVDLGPDLSLCPSINATLDATNAGATYSWSTGAVTPSISVGPGSYDVTVTASGCSAGDAITIGAYPAAQVDLGNDLTLCPGDQVLLDVAQPGASYVWQDGSTGASYLAQSTEAVSVQLTDANGCVANDAINVNVQAPVPVDLGPDAVICVGDQLILDATTPGATAYLWSTGAVTPTITVSANNSYSVTVTQGSCDVSDAIQVDALPLPVIDLGADQTICTGDQVVLDATLAGAGYLWSTGAITPTITVGQGGAYAVTLTNAAGCTYTDQITIVEATPDALDLGPDLTLCAGQSALLTAALPGASYLWSTGSVANAITVGTTGTYWVQATQGLCSVSDTVEVAVQPVPDAQLPADQTLCDGESLVLDAQWPGATYQWSTGATTPSITVTADGTYDVVVDLNGCTDSDEIDVEFTTPQLFDLGADLTLCAGEQASFSPGVIGGSYLWSTGSNASSITVSTTGQVWVQITEGACVGSDTVNVLVQPVPDAQLPVDQTLCDGESLLLDAQWPGATYQWSTGATTPSITVTADGTYDVIVDLNGCTDTDAINVSFTTPQSFDLGADQVLCAGEQATFSPGVIGGSYLWNNGSTASSLTASTTSQVWVQITEGACVTSDTVDVLVVDPGAIDLGDAITVCEGETVALDATLPNATYAWSTGETTPVINVDSDGTYSVTASVGACTATDEVLVSFIPLPAVDIGPDQTICPDGTATFDATTPGATYLWQDGSTNATYSTGTAEAVSVEVTVLGCATTDGASVIALPAPVADLGNDTTICDGTSLLLSAAQPNATYGWSTGSASATISVTTAGTYGVTVDLNGCLASDAITVSVFDPADLDLGPDLTLCPGESVALSASMDGEFLWSTGSAANAITVSSTGTYWLNVSQAACIATDTVNVYVVPLIAPELGSSIHLCEGDSAVIGVVPGGAEVAWSTGSTSDSITVTSSGTYSVELSLMGCIATDAVVVSVTEWTYSLSLGDDSTFCPNEPLILNTGLEGTTHLWSTGSDAPMIEVMTPGTYSVHVTGECIDAEARITVSEGLCGPYIHVPNTVTPNNDGNNDVFGAVYYGPLRDYTMDIFNRWGQRIASLDHPDKAWDCTFDGQPVPDGVYIWKIRYRARAEDGAKAEELIGHVNVLR